MDNLNCTKKQNDMKTLTNSSRKNNSSNKNFFDDFFTIEFIDVVETKWQFLKNQNAVSQQTPTSFQKLRLS